MSNVILQAAIHNAIVGAALAAIAWAITRLWRDPPATRWLWIIVLVKFLTPPLWPVPIDVGVMPIWPERAAVDSAGAVDVAEPIATVAAAENVAAGNATATAESAGVSWSTIVLAIWLIGSVAWVLMASSRILAFDRLQRESSVELPELTRRVAELSQQLGLPAAPQARVVQAAIAPVLWSSWRQPIILVPRELLARLDAQQRDAVLAHELVHFRRRDHWVRWLSLLALALYWWHPAVWFACRQLRESEEDCCDATVLGRLPIDSHAYAEALFQTVCFARTSREPLPALGFSRENHLKRRVETILGSTARPIRSLRLALIAWAAAIPLSVRLVQSQETAPAAGTAPGEAPISAEADDPKAAEKNPARVAALTPGKTGADEFAFWRATRPYGDIGFPGKQFGPHWEFVRLATHPGVMKELAASDEQRAQLKEVWTSHLAKDGKWHLGGKGQRDLLKNDFDEASDILSEKQQTRIRELIVQRMGLAAFLDEGVRSKLELSAEQVERIRREITDHGRRVAQHDKALKEKTKSIESDPESKGVLAEGLRIFRLQLNQAKRDSLVAAWQVAWGVLTPEQRRTYEKLAGDVSPQVVANFGASP